MTDRLEGLKQSIERIIGWAKSGKGAEDYSMDIGDVDRMADAILAAVQRHMVDPIEDMYQKSWAERLSMPTDDVCALRYAEGRSHGLRIALQLFREPDPALSAEVRP